MTRNRIQAYCIILSLFAIVILLMCDVVHADDKIRLDYLPVGKRLQVKGVDYIAYDLDAFKSLAEFDVRYGDLQTRVGLLEERLHLDDERIAALSVDLAFAEEELKKIEGLAHHPVLPPDPCPAPDGFWNRTDHLVLEGVLTLIIIGGVVYGLAK